MRRLALFVWLAFACGGRTRLDPGGQGQARDAGATPVPKISAAPSTTPPPSATRFAVIGDYGIAGATERQVADLVIAFDPHFIITTGDNNYPSGAAETIDANIGQYFHAFIAPYRGSFGEGAATNRFFPSLGNHDWMTPGAEPYLEYFELPHNERYYDVVEQHVHLFALDSDSREPDGVSAGGAQAAWLEERLRASPERWKIVYFHHPPYSSGSHGSSPELRWPFREWGASIVYSGHDHTYERFAIDGLTYVVNGVGGNALYEIGTRLEGSQAAFDEEHGAVLVWADRTELVSRFVTADGRVLDEFRLAAE